MKHGEEKHERNERYPNQIRKNDPDDPSIIEASSSNHKQNGNQEEERNDAQFIGDIVSKKPKERARLDYAVAAYSHHISQSQDACIQ